MKIKAALPLIIGAILSVLISIVANLTVTQIAGKTSIVYILLILIIIFTIVLILTTELYSKLNREKKIKEKEQESAVVLQPSSSHLESIDTLTVDDEIKFESENIIREVKEAQKATERQEDLNLPEEVSRAIDEVVRTATVSPRAALLLLSATIEGQMRSRLEEVGIDVHPAFVLSSDAINRAIMKGLLPLQTASAFRDFRTVRNGVAHDQARGVSDKTILPLVTTGIELLKILSAREQIDTEISNSDRQDGR